MNYGLGFYDSFKPSLNELTKHEYTAAMKTIMELAEAPENPGLNVHRVGTAATNCWSARVNDDIRLIFFRSGNHVIPAYVDHHDDAYRWAEGRSLEVHPDTGAAQSGRPVVLPGAQGNHPSDRLHGWRSSRCSPVARGL